MNPIFITKNCSNVVYEGDNQIRGNAILEDSQIRFYGKNNICLFGEGASLKKSSIHFEGDNAIFWIEKRLSGGVKARLGSNSNIVIGKNCRLGILEIGAESDTNLIIGNDFLSAFNVKIWNSDFHCIWDNMSRERINNGKSIYIGDHVWIAYEAMLLKGTRCFSGSVIGARSLLSGHTVPSNSIIAGHPARIIKSGISWTRDSPIHMDKDSLSINDDFIFTDDNSDCFSIIEENLKNTIEYRIEYIHNNIIKNNNRNRFCKLIY